MSLEYQYKAIAAMADNRVIGYENGIPWHLPEDFKWFKKMTLGHTLLMGRKTFESIGKALPGRQTLILSRQAFSAEGCTSVPTLEAVEAASEHALIWVAGGAEIYRSFLPKCSELYLTRVHKSPKGDTFFPEFEPYFQLETIVEENTSFSIEHWIRKD